MITELRTYRDEKHGFEIDIPGDWSLESGKLPLGAAVISAVRLGWVPNVEVQFCGANEAVNISIEPMQPEPPPDITALLFTKYAQDMGYVNCVPGRITVGGRQHSWARYEVPGRVWSKKYMLVLDGNGYAITASCTDQRAFPQKEMVWDAVAASFRLLRSNTDPRIAHNMTSEAYRTIDRLRETLEIQLDRRARNLSYGKAIEAIESNQYGDARIWLEKCLQEFSEGDANTQVFILKQMVPVLRKLGDNKGLLNIRKELKRLNPSDRGNRMELVELLAGCGYQNEAVQEVDQLIALEPTNSAYQDLKTNLINRSRSNPVLKFVLSAAYFLFVCANVFAGGFILKVPWLAGFFCLPAAHYLNLSGRWIGLTREISDRITIAIFLLTLAVLVFKGNMHFLLLFLYAPLVIPILKDNALRDQ